MTMQRKSFTVASIFIAVLFLLSGCTFHHIIEYRAITTDGGAGLINKRESVCDALCEIEKECIAYISDPNHTEADYKKWLEDQSTGLYNYKEICKYINYP